MKELGEKIVNFAKERDWLLFNTPENLAKININRGRRTIRVFSME